MSFPTINNRQQLTFQVAAYSNTTLSPWCSDSVAPAPIPTITIASAATNGTTLSACRLYYKSVKFSPQLNQQLVQKLNSGYVKKVFYRVTDTYLPAAAEIAQTTGSISKLVSASTVRPLRVWLLAPNTQGLSSAGDGTLVGVFAFPGTFTNLQIQINNSNYYQNSLNTVAEIWSILEDQFPGSGSSNSTGGLISYADFINSYRLHCFDVSRSKDRLSSPNEAVSIQVSGTRVNSTSCDYYYIVERLQAVTMHFGASETKLVIGL